jgi:hypothetical protein
LLDEGSGEWRTAEEPRGALGGGRAAAARHEAAVVGLDTPSKTETLSVVVGTSKDR